MPLITMDDNTALIVTDLQKIIVMPACCASHSAGDSFTRIFPRLGETSTAARIIDLLKKRI